MTTPTEHYPLVEVSGTPYQMGYAHGRQAADRVVRFVEMLTEGHDRQRVLGAVRWFVPLFEKHCPHLVAEIRGLADGAAVSLEEAYLLQIRGEVLGAMDLGGCTTFAIGPDGTAAGSRLIGQNSDMGHAQEEVGIVLHAVPDRGPRLLMWTFGGQLGYHGMNSVGVAQFANSLSGGPGWRLGLPHYPLKRRMLEQTTVDEVLAQMDAMPVSSNGNYMLTGGCARIVDVELTPEGYATIDPDERAFLVHANHFLSDRFRTPDTDTEALPDSLHRQRRMTDLIATRWGHITVDDMKEFLSDHQDGPKSICRHDTDEAFDRAMTVGKTVASLIAEPDAGRLHVATGNPCEGRWAAYEV